MDEVALAALVIAVLWSFALYRRRARQFAFAPPFALQVVLWSALAAALSALYVPWYLRGGPRVIDATSYFLAAKAIASGAFCFAPGLPSAAVRGRFLVGADASECVGVLFPPGYPLALAAAVAAHAPLVFGPLTAAAQTSVLMLLARRHIGEVGAGIAAALYVLCACARYHTADTMSHGWAALLLTSSCYAWGFRRAWGDGVAGACWGWLVATRPVTGLVGLLALALLTRGDERALRPLSTRALSGSLGALPFLGLWLSYNHALTGSALYSPQTLYYALADGAPGCFRYGFGVDIGCKHEHGDFVARFMPAGYGSLEALGTTCRRLLQHLRDAGNSELGALALVLASCSQRVRREHAWLPLVIGAQVLAYLPFYYDGNYPAGGARMFADVLPLEHLLLAAWLTPFGWRGWAAPLALIGFALHTAYDHALLAAREGGRPYFERALVEAAGVRRGLVFVPSDHGFNLAHEPAARAPALEFLRWRGDGHDRVAWEQRGKPLAYVYDWIAGVTPAPRLVPYDVAAHHYRFEAEGQWPVLAIDDGWARPEARAAPCVSRGQALVFSASGGAPRLVLELPVPATGAFRVRIGSEGELAARVSLDGRAIPLEVTAAPNGGCREQSSAALALEAGARRLELQLAPGASARIDYVELSPLEP